MNAEAVVSGRRTAILAAVIALPSPGPPLRWSASSVRHSAACNGTPDPKIPYRIIDVDLNLDLDLDLLFAAEFHPKADRPNMRNSR